MTESHFLLSDLINQYDKKLIQNKTPEVEKKNKRSKSIHLYVDENIEAFLQKESLLNEVKWGLRKNAGLGSLIQKFIENFSELKKREERQLQRIKKSIDEFRKLLVEFKKSSQDLDNYQKTENINQLIQSISTDMVLILSLLEFEKDSLKKALGNDLYTWLDFILKWKSYS